ncbi:MAG: prepilin-type N-terminal cleavage/methylation domain-containing protein, partial [Armatimonadetes bacterium]|nr:prepilin-type N-terminal cleavage/methylation domain-containing protein [Armatimonadota bacterium]
MPGDVAENFLCETRRAIWKNAGSRELLGDRRGIPRVSARQTSRRVRKYMKALRRMRESESGFTLIEIMIV